MRRHSIRLFFAAIVSVFVLTLALSSTRPAMAGGSGGIAVRPARVCLDGVRFTGRAELAAVLGRTFTGEIFRGHVGVPTPLVATGNSHVYAAVNENAQYVVTYPVGTFAVGEDVTYSALSNDGSGYGGGQFGSVENCTISRRPTTGITAGSWTNVATLVEDTCGGAAAGATFPVTLTPGPGVTHLTLDWYAQHFSMTRTTASTYTGKTLVGGATYRLTLTFGTTSSYTGNLEVKFPSCPKGHWLIKWVGTTAS